MGAAQSTLANVEELSPKIARNMQKRLKISQEVVETEKNYSRAIDTCVQHIVLPLKHKRIGINIPKTDVIIMFEALEAVNTLQKTFLKELIRLVRDKDAKFANLFVRFAYEFKVVYSGYFNSYNDSVKMICKYRSKNHKFDNYLEAISKREDCQSIDSIMIMPIQRLPRYVLMLEDFLKHTPKNHPQYDEVEKALENMKAITEFVNTEREIAENQKEMLDIQNMLPIDSELLMDRRRHLISHSIQKAKKGKSYHDFHFFLFNDMLLVGKERKTAKLHNHRKLKESDRSPLFKVTFTGKDAQNRTFNFTTRFKEWFIKFDSQQELEQWVINFHKVIDASPRPTPPTLQRRKSVSYRLNKPDLKLKDNRKSL